MYWLYDTVAEVMSELNELKTPRRGEANYKTQKQIAKEKRAAAEQQLRPEASLRRKEAKAKAQKLAEDRRIPPLF